MATKLRRLVVAILISDVCAVDSANYQGVARYTVGGVPMRDIEPEEEAIHEAEVHSVHLVSTPYSVNDFLTTPTSQQANSDLHDQVDQSSNFTNDKVTKKLARQVEQKAMEDVISDLIKGKSEASFGATPFGGSVKKIVALIDKEMKPKVIDGHKADQAELLKLSMLLAKCGRTKNTMIGIAEKSKKKYFKFSPLHKTCRTGEAGLSIERTDCYKELKDKKKVMELRCREFIMIDRKLGNQKANMQIVKKGGSERTESYINRLDATFCGGKRCGFRCQFQKAKKRCLLATKDFQTWTAKCRKIHKAYSNKVNQCNNLQDQMDLSACKRAVDMKDACETYSECSITKRQAYFLAYKTVKQDEKDRWAEWKGLMRMQCFMKAFMDGKVSNYEIKMCKDRTYSVSHLNIKYPKLAKLQSCQVPKEYPYTGDYKKKEFSPLPTLAKGRPDKNKCTGLIEISTKPAAGSPKSCKCERLTMNGPYSPGPLVKCSRCLDIRRTTDKGSCPAGTKLFSPRSRQDWKTFLATAKPLRAPHWIIDITRPKNGCGGCTRSPMNSGSRKQNTWTTSDGSPWWLRSTRYNEPNGDYHGNCYLDLWRTPKSENHVTWNDGSCNYHSKSYYCQLKALSLTPKPGSPNGCTCQKVELTAKYTAGALVKCSGCLTVHKAKQKNSCPLGTKIFSPATRRDWKVFIDSAKPLRAPHWIVDVTRPANGCGGCTRHAMNSVNSAQKTWRTADGSAWWLRSSRYNEPNGDYSANCYLDLWQAPANENAVTFNDGRCHYRSKSYYCQPVKRR